MLIGHANFASEFRGGERQTWLLMQELSSRGYRQRLIAREGSGLAERATSIDTLDIVAVRTNPLALARATDGCTLVHAHEARAVYAGLLGYWLRRTPFVITRRVMRPQKRSWARDRAYHSAAAVAAVSTAVSHHIRQTYPAIEPIVIPSAHAELPVDASVTMAIRDRYPGKKIIGHVGTYFHRVKGQLTIIEAAHRAAREHPDWHFLLIGAGKDESLFREKIGALQNIELTGFVDNVGDYLAACDVFVFPSLDEALGSSLLDAMQFGLPIVASRAGGIPEIVEDGVNGILVDPESAGQLYAGIERLTRESEEAAAMHLANRSRAAQFSTARMADSYERLYRKIL
jgi:glycosyltransferase involved in cell wall biosynthesis